jgi:hypothetical protein
LVWFSTPVPPQQVPMLPKERTLPSASGRKYVTLGLVVLSASRREPRMWLTRPRS